MPNAYHHVFFTVREGIAEDEVLERLRRYRSLAVDKGYIQRAEDFSVGQVVIPAVGDNEVARLRQITGGFTWAITIRLDGREALDRYLREFPVDIQAGQLSRPPDATAQHHGA